ncbi:hypothetical protein BKA64DRAFT_704238 [Cadophora sp. MPI-SDFR-AT-0126]|nr:hypothetical protein BKA64DRAFT_704238 [Leotiomycetes sp. MPI-SDFR-AT-0126]
MFRGSSRSRGEAPIRIPQPDVPASRERSNWRPALRRIKKGLFPKSGVPDNSNMGKPEGAYSATGRTLLEIHQQRLNERNAKPSTTSQVDTQAKQLDSRYSNVLRKQRPVPKGPREPKESSAFNFVKRSLSRSGSRRRSVQEPREPIFVMQDIKKGEVEIISAGPAIASTAPYIPRHAASDFQKISSSQSQQQSSTYIIPRKPVPGQAQTSTQTPPKAAYQPKHAASDFSKLKLPFNLDPNGLAQHSSDQNTNATNSPSRMSDADLDDYQRFLKASRLAAAGNYNSYGVISSSNFTPKTSQIVQEMISNQQSMEREREKERERAYAMSQHSTASRQGSKAGSIFDRVVGYVRPGREGSVRSQRTGFTSLDDRGSLSSVLGDGEGEGRRRSGSRWRRVGGSIRRSFSRDGEGDGVEGGNLDEKEAGGRGRKRSRIMPLSPGMKRFNQAVKNGGY